MADPHLYARGMILINFDTFPPKPGFLVVSSCTGFRRSKFELFAGSLNCSTLNSLPHPRQVARSLRHYVAVPTVHACSRYFCWGEGQPMRTCNFEPSTFNPRV